MVLTTQGALFLTAQPSLVTEGQYQHHGSLFAIEHTAKKMRRWYFLIFLIYMIIITTQKACLAFQIQRNTGCLMQRAFHGGAFKIWMKNATRVKQEARVGSCTTGLLLALEKLLQGQKRKWTTVIARMALGKMNRLVLVSPTMGKHSWNDEGRTKTQQRVSGSSIWKDV